MSEDDDWFERALRGSSDGTDDADGTEDDGDDEDWWPPAGAADAEGAIGDEEVPAEADEDLFEENFASAFGGDTGADPVPGGEAAADQVPGEEPSGDGPFGGGAGADAGSEFGFGPAEPDEFDEEGLESYLDRIDLGVEGLDEMIRGGVPERSLMAVIGSAGTGKTTFGLQFLAYGLRQGERAIYITLEEDEDRIVDSAVEKGWPFDEYVAEDRLAIVDMDPVEMASSLGSIRDELPGLVDRFGADRLVLDSVSLLELMYEDRARRRNEVYAFTRSLKRAGVTTLLVSEASTNDPYTSKHGIVEYLTDAVFVMQFVRSSQFERTRLAIEIQKIRDANHSREMKPYEITDDGLEVYQQTSIF